MSISLFQGVSLVPGGTRLPRYKTIEVSSTYSTDGTEDILFCSGTFTVTLLDPAVASKAIFIRNVSGTTTLATEAGSIETTTLTVGQSVTLAPRSTGWFIV